MYSTHNMSCMSNDMHNINDNNTQYSFTYSQIAQYRSQHWIIRASIAYQVLANQYHPDLDLPINIILTLIIAPPPPSGGPGQCSARGRPGLRASASDSQPELEEAGILGLLRCLACRPGAAGHSGRLEGRCSLGAGAAGRLPEPVARPSGQGPEAERQGVKHCFVQSNFNC